jgi:hypothetical protein
MKVSNRWANRLVGDTKFSEAQRRARTGLAGTGTPGVAWATPPLRDVGDLAGPVRLITAAKDGSSAEAVPKVRLKGPYRGHPLGGCGLAGGIDGGDDVARGCL